MVSNKEFKGQNADKIRIERHQKKLNRRKIRLERFKRSREQTLRNTACKTCYWLDRSFGQSPCKSCKRFDAARKHDKFKAKKR